MTMEKRESLRLLLSQYFNYEFYLTAIERIRAALATGEISSERWGEIARLIRERRLDEGDALALVNHAANQAIDENSDAEAYAWLDLMVANVEGTGEIVEY
jgi:hypothetical protein